MKQPRSFVTPLIMLGMLTILLAALLFAEERKEDGHLPERNGHGSGEMLFPLALTGLAAIPAPGSRISGSGAEPHPGHRILPAPMGMRCLSAH